MAPQGPVHYTAANVIPGKRMPSGVRVYCDNVNCGMAAARKAFIHISPTTHTPPPCRNCGEAFPIPDFSKYERRTEGPWPLKNNKAMGPQGGGGRASTPIRPIPKTWADVAASRGASRASTPARSQVEAGYGQDRQAPRRQGNTATETSLLESVAVLLRNAESSSNPASAELLRDAATTLLQSNAKQQVNPSSSSQPEPDPLTAARQRVATLSAKVKACVNRSTKLREQAERQFAEAQASYTAYEDNEKLVNQSREELEQAKTEHERMRSCSAAATPTPTPPPPSLSSAFGINLDPLCASARKEVEQQMATMVATIQNAVRSALEQQAQDTALHEGADAPEPGVTKPADDVPMEPAPGSQKRMRESSPARAPTPRSRTRSPEREVSRSRSPTGKPEQAVKEKLADLGQKLAASSGKAAEARAAAANSPAEAKSSG